MSEQTGTVDDLFSVDVNSSCYSIVTCSPMEPIQECTAYCGPSDDVTALITNRGSIDTGSGTITIQLPPATGDIYHCVVSGSRNNGTVVFRGRQQQTVRGEGTHAGKIAVNCMCSSIQGVHCRACYQMNQEH